MPFSRAMTASRSFTALSTEIDVRMECSVGRRADRFRPERVDPETAHVKVRRFIAVDDCGVRINPMIVEGQIHGGLAEGVGIALMELISFDEDGTKTRVAKRTGEDI